MRVGMSEDEREIRALKTRIVELESDAAHLRNHIKTLEDSIQRVMDKGPIHEARAEALEQCAKVCELYPDDTGVVAAIAKHIRDGANLALGDDNA